MKAFLFELCVEDLKSAQVAEVGGADRIELCAALLVGGITPDLNLIAATTKTLSIPVHVLIRPRGGKFVFSAAESGLMRQQITQAKAAGASGIAIGALLANGCVDVKRTREMVELARPMKVTFHRAFDETPDPVEALEDVVRSGADCLLTSGGKPDVLTGAEMIARLCRLANGRLDVMAGGGLRLASLVEVLRRTGVTYLHGSLTRRLTEPGEGHAESNGHTAATGPIVLEADVREAIRLLHQEFAARESEPQTGLSYSPLKQ